MGISGILKELQAGMPDLRFRAGHARTDQQMLSQSVSSAKFSILSTSTSCSSSARRISLTPWVLRLVLETPPTGVRTRVPLFGDQHDFIIARDRYGTDHLAVARPGLDGDHALAGTIMHRVFLDSGAFPVPVFSGHQDFGLAHAWLQAEQAYDTLSLVQPDSAHTPAGAPRGRNALFTETDCFACIADHQKLGVSMCHHNINKIVVVTQIHRNDTAGPRPGKRGQTGFP